jgi:hypothetical protein
MKEEQKYFGEAAVLQATKGVALIKPAELPAIAKSPKILAELVEAHIYFVCRRPRVRLDKGGSRKPDGIQITLHITDKTGMLTRGLLLPDASLPPRSYRN